ncbi:unnamed protein product [Rotaria magnacalcarata]|nr:unnamed protein product [Rotaria magnacalcarata]
MTRIIFICFILFPIAINGKLRSCPSTDVFIWNTVQRAPLVVYGKSIGKVIYVDNDAELLFNVTFRVECILKGQDIKNRIEITDAGIKSDRIACQYLDPGNAYVVFLEKCGLNMNAYCPIDVQERLADDTTLELLEKTCRLKRNPPLDSLSNNCPSVSMPEFCHYNNISTKRKVVDYINTNDKPLFNNGTQIFHGSNKIIIKEGKLIDLIGDNPRNCARLLTVNSLWVINLAVSVLMCLLKIN